MVIYVPIIPVWNTEWHTVILSKQKNWSWDRVRKIFHLLREKTELWKQCPPTAMSTYSNVHLQQCPPTAMSTYSPWYFGTKKYLLSAFEMNVYFWKFIINSKHIIVLLYQVPYKKWSSNSAVLYNSLLIVHVILECLYIFICRINCCVKHGVLWQLTYIHDTCTYTEHSDNMMLPPSHSSAKTHSRE